MLWRTHLAFAFFLGALAVHFLSFSWLFLFAALLGSLLPDVDHPRSKLGSFVPFLSLFFTHRGFFHGIIALFLFPFLASLLFPSSFLSQGIFLGYLSHLFLDAATRKGIMPLHPFLSWRVHGPARSGSFFETMLFIVSVAAGALVLI